MDIDKRIEEALDDLADSAIDRGRIATIPAREKLRALSRDVRRAALEEVKQAARAAYNRKWESYYEASQQFACSETWDYVNTAIDALIDKEPTWPPTTTP